MSDRHASQALPSDPARQVRSAVSSLRSLGTLFLLLAGLAGVAMAHDGLHARGMVPFAASAAVLFVGPGLLYHVTAVLIRRHDVGVAVLARRTAVVQSALAGLAAVVSVAAGGFGRGRLPPAVLPATVTIFFAPALLAQAYQIGTALAALRQMPDARRGFAVEVPTPVLPVDGGDADHPT